jgi:plastocyanin
VGTRAHTITSNAGLWDSGELAPGRTVAVYFAKPGTYRYHSIRDPDLIQGTVIVE